MRLLGPNLRRSLHASTAVLFASGGVWLLAHYLPLRQWLPQSLGPVSMQVHGSAAAIMLVLCGSAIALHSGMAWRERKNRVSGAVLGAALLVISVTGVCLYYAGDETARNAASLAHWLVGLALPLLFTWHALKGRKAGRQERPYCDR